MQSDFLKINWRDIGHGFIVAFGTSVLTGLYDIINGGGMPTMEQLKTIGMIGLGAGISYLIKKVFTNSDNQLGK